MCVRGYLLNSERGWALPPPCRERPRGWREAGPTRGGGGGPLAAKRRQPKRGRGTQRSRSSDVGVAGTPTVSATARGRQAAWSRPCARLVGVSVCGRAHRGGAPPSSRWLSTRGNREMLFMYVQYSETCARTAGASQRARHSPNEYVSHPSAGDFARAGSCLGRVSQQKGCGDRSQCPTGGGGF